MKDGRGWRNLGEKPVVETPRFRLRQAEVELPGGQRIEWIPLREIPGLVAEGRIRAAVTAASLLYLLQQRL